MFSVLYKKGGKYVEVLPASRLGISRNDQQFLTDLKFLGESKVVKIHDVYEMITGKRKACENFASEKVFSYSNSNKQPLKIIFRAYNDGVAFRYVFPNQSSSEVNITNADARTRILSPT